MKHTTRSALFSIIVSMLAASVADGTPSTQIWSPSTDIQPYKVWHLGLDNYVRTNKSGIVSNNVYDAGLTVGVIPSSKIQMETGFDLIDTGTSSPADSHPLYFNAKIGAPEGAARRLWRSAGTTLGQRAESRPRTLPMDWSRKPFRWGGCQQVTTAVAGKF